VAPRFAASSDNSPEVKILTSHSGSMTQENFFHYVNHFLQARPTNPGPIILLLDGHGSRWSVPALRKLIANNVFPFFFASHTSIWAQPNDAGVNKRFHWAIEQSAVTARRDEEQPTLDYFNEILKEGWIYFLEAERCDLRALGLNNTTNAYARTGVFPLDPFASAWTEAIETLGGVENARIREEMPKAQYEALLVGNLPIITDEEKKVIRADLTLDPLIDESDSAVALIRGGEILAKWRRAIDEAVREGEEYETMARAILPGSTATAPAHQVAMKFLTFEFVDIFKVELPVKRTKEEREYTTSVRIVRNTKMSEPVKVTYLETDDAPTSHGRNGAVKHMKGTAIKLRDGWKVFLYDGRELKKSAMELVDVTSFFVDYAFEKMTDEQKRRQKQKEKRERAREQVLLEEQLKVLAKEERMHHDKKEYETMCEQIVSYVDSKGQTERYCFETYLAMTERLRAPFKTEIDGHSVTVSAADTAIMLKQSAIEIIKTHVLGGKRSSGNDNQQPTNNKRQRTAGGNQAVPTQNGTEGFTALHQSTGRDVRLSVAALKKKKCGLDAEAKNINKSLEALEKRKKRCSQLLERHRQQQQQQQKEREQRMTQQQQQQQARIGQEEENSTVSENQALEQCETQQQQQQERQLVITGERRQQQQQVSEQQQQQQQASNGQEREHCVSENSHEEIMRPSSEIMSLSTVERYWDVRANSAQDILVLMLRMFLPACGVLSKSRAIQWSVVEKEVLPRLSKAAVDAKEQEYHRRLDTIEGELAELAQISSKEDDIPGNDVGETRDATVD
jgi:hypothetical protein